MRVNRRKIISGPKTVRRDFEAPWYIRSHFYIDPSGDFCRRSGIKFGDYPDRRWEEKYRPEWCRHVSPVITNSCFWPVTWKVHFQGESMIRYFHGRRTTDFIHSQKDIPPAFNKVIDDNFWELF